MKSPSEKNSEMFNIRLFHIFRLQWVIFVVFIIGTGSCTQLRYSARKNMTVVFYNVENLFDTENTTGTRDGEFTPEGRNKWDEVRYEKKLNDLALAISNINPNDLPEIVGLSEVENEQVVNDLMNTGALANAGYRLVHYESPDLRGIDCALIYRTAEFNVMYHEPVRVNFPDAPNSRTRDILYVKGQARNREEFHIFVNHWPSRIGGVAQTEPKRLRAAAILKNKIDSVRLVNPQAHILVMGDMNDEPDNNSLKVVLNAGRPESGHQGLVNMMYPDFEGGKGSYYYRGSYDMLDNIIVSPSLLDSKGWRIAGSKGHIYSDEWMVYINKPGDQVPNRTYGGANYYGGVSDHFPVYLRLSR